MFNKDFYPTPGNVIEMMTSGLDLAGKVVLDPSAGSGKIVDFCKCFGADVVACELYPELREIVSKKCHLLKPDFFDVKAEEVSHVDFIIMNPPFSNADRHIQHAWNVAPAGCQIIALCNAETLNNRYSRQRTELYEIIKKNGNWINIGDAFSDAERKTGVDVALIRMFKPKTGDSEFDGYYFDLIEEAEATGSGLVRHNQIKEIVDRYVGAVKMFDSVMASNKTINEIIKPISSGLNISFGAHNTRDRYSSEIDRDTFKKELQKSAWRTFFSWMKMDKYITSGVMADINRFVEQQQHVPFTMTNLFKVAQIIQGTHSGRMDRVLVEAFDKICSLSADNSEAGEKWKTNSNYKVNRRFIINRAVEPSYSHGFQIRYGMCEEVDDIVKALCFITGKKYEDQIGAHEWFNNSYRIKCDGKYLSGYECTASRADDYRINSSLNNLINSGKKAEIVKINKTWGEWVEWNDFFRVRGYKKGTMHFEFVDENVWMEFNRRVAKIKGWAIPQKTNSKTKGTERTKKTGVEIW